MFGLFSKKKKRDEVIQSVLTEEEKIAIREYKEKIRKDNKDLFMQCMTEFIDKRKDEFMKNVPQPFKIGQSVTYDYYRLKSYVSLGWHSSIANAASTFKDIDAFKGTFTAPVFKIYVDTSYLYEKIENLWLNDSTFNTDKPIQKSTIEARISSYITRLSHDRNHKLMEWIVDFNWAELKLPYTGSDEGWLNLRWGGFIAECFLPTDSKTARREIKMWKKENEFLKEKQRFEKKKIQMENEIKKMRMKAKFENHDNSIENTLARQD